jgi:hypothetical protein
MKRKWGLWIIGENWSRGNEEGHWYRITKESGARVFDSKAKAERHKKFLECNFENHNKDTKCYVEPFEDEQTPPEKDYKATSKEHKRATTGTAGNSVLANDRPRVWKKPPR